MRLGVVGLDGGAAAAVAWEQPAAPPAQHEAVARARPALREHQCRNKLVAWHTCSGSENHRHKNWMEGNRMLTQWMKAGAYARNPQAELHLGCKGSRWAATHSPPQQGSQL